MARKDKNLIATRIKQKTEMGSDFKKMTFILTNGDMNSKLYRNTFESSFVESKTFSDLLHKHTPEVLKYGNT